MTIKPLHSETEYKATLKTVSALVDADPHRGTPEADQLEVLGTLRGAYEAKHFPVNLPHPVEAIKFRMEQRGLKPKDLQSMIDDLNREWEVLNRKRLLSLRVLRHRQLGLGISVDCLIQATA